MRRAQLNVVLTREPGGTAAGDLIRQLVKSGQVKDPMTELMLFQASRAELVNIVIRPTLKAGQHVVSDRYTPSTIAYQGYGRGIPLDIVPQANHLATQGLEPDLTFILQTDATIQNQRRQARLVPADNFENEGQGFPDRVREGYRSSPLATWRSIDASRPADQVAAAIWNMVQRLFEQA